MKRIAVLTSNKGSGSNLQVLIDHCEKGKIKGEIVVVVSDKENAYGLVRAKNHKIPTLVRPFKLFKDKSARKKYAENLAKELRDDFQIDLVVLAGWMIILPPVFIKYFLYRVINLHPGLITDKQGEDLILSDGSVAQSLEGEMAAGAIAKAIERGITISGSTVHFVTEIVDWGPVIMRTEEKFHKNDTADSYYSRLKRKEHIILPFSVKLFCDDKLEIKDDIVLIRDRRYKKHRV